jgi:threonine dehydratase
MATIAPTAAGTTMALPDIADIRAAHARVAPYVHRTPVLTCAALDELVGARLYFKCENFQKVGAFKARGACKRRVLACGRCRRRRVWSRTLRATTARHSLTRRSGEAYRHSS